MAMIEICSVLLLRRILRTVSKFTIWQPTIILSSMLLKFLLFIYAMKQAVTRSVVWPFHGPTAACWAIAAVSVLYTFTESAGLLERGLSSSQDL
jgi:hypothetical protein